VGVWAIRRRGDDDLFNRRAEVLLRIGAFGEEAGGFDDDIGADRSQSISRDLWSLKTLKLFLPRRSCHQCACVVRQIAEDGVVLQRCARVFASVTSLTATKLNDTIAVEGKSFQGFQDQRSREIDWASVGADIVVESTGLFTKGPMRRSTSARRLKRSSSPRLRMAQTPPSSSASTTRLTIRRRTTSFPTPPAPPTVSPSCQVSPGNLRHQ